MNKAQWFAAYKLMEECGELVTVLAKLAMFPSGNHPSKKFEGRPIWQDIADEIADVQAASTYLLRQFTEIPMIGIEGRRKTKLDLYEQYVNENT